MMNKENNMCATILFKTIGFWRITPSGVVDCTRTIGLWHVNPSGFYVHHRTLAGPSEIIYHTLSHFGVLHILKKLSGFYQSYSCRTLICKILLDEFKYCTTGQKVTRISPSTALNQPHKWQR